jgi:hypothetical protein
LGARCRNPSSSAENSSGPLRNGKRLFKKRDALKHPKNPDDLNVDDPVWDEIYAGLLWLTNEICFPDFLNQKYLSPGKDG